MSKYIVDDKTHRLHAFQGEFLKANAPTGHAETRFTHKLVI